MPLLNFGVDSPDIMSGQGLEPIAGSDVLTSLGNMPERTAELSNQNLLPMNVPSSVRPSAQSQLISPQNEGLSVMQMIGAALGGPSAGTAIRQRNLQQQMLPVLNEFSTKFSQAIRSGDLETAEALTNQLNKYGDMSPMALELAKQAATKLDAKRKDISSNNIILDTAKEAFQTDPAALKVVESLRGKVGDIDPTLLQKQLEGFRPQLKVDGNWTSLTSTTTGKQVAREVQSEVLTTKDLTPQVKQAMSIARANNPNLPTEVEFLKEQNEYKNGMPKTEAQRKPIEAMQRAVDEGVRTDVEHGRFPAPQRMGLDLNSQNIGAITDTGPGNLSTTQGTPSGVTQGTPSGVGLHNLNAVQQNTFKFIQDITKDLKFKPEEAGAFTKVIGQESRLGVNLNHTGEFYGPGAVGQAALDDVNKALGGKPTTLKDIKDNPDVGLYIAAKYFQILLQRNNGNIDKAVQAYNNSTPEDGRGDPNYLENVKKWGSNFGLTRGTSTGVTTGKGTTVDIGITKTSPGSEEYPPFQEKKWKSIQERANAYKQWLDEKAEFGKTSAANEAKRLTEPMPATDESYKWNPETGIIEKSPTRLGIDQSNRQGYTTVQMTTKKKERVDAYSSMQNEAKDVTQLVQNASDAAMDGDFTKALAQSVATGLNLPVVGRVAFGQYTLTPEQKSLITRLTAFSQTAETVINPSGAASAQTGLVKSFISGATANREDALKTIDDVLHIGTVRIAGELGIPLNTTGPGPRVNEVSPRAVERARAGTVSGLETLAEKSQIGQRQYAKAVVNRFEVALPEAVKAVKQLPSIIQEYYQSAGDAEDKAKLLKRANDLALNEKTKAFLRNAIEIDMPKEGLLKRLGQVLKNAKPSTGYKTQYEAITPNWAKKSPVNKETESQLKSVNE